MAMGLRRIGIAFLVLSGLADCSAAAQPQPVAVHDTSINPFIMPQGGKEIGDPFPSYWDDVWHVYTLSADLRQVYHLTSTDLVKWTEHAPAMAGAFRRIRGAGPALRHRRDFEEGNRREGRSAVWRGGDGVRFQERHAGRNAAEDDRRQGDLPRAGRPPDPRNRRRGRRLLQDRGTAGCRQAVGHDLADRGGWKSDP